MAVGGSGHGSTSLIGDAIRVGFAILAIVLLSGCATQPPADPAAPGFLFGLLHGFIAPVALIAGFFTDVRIYAFPNSGGLYDFGFLIGLSPWAGGAAASSAS